MANGSFGGGNGTKRKPYLVEDAYDLNAVRNDTYAYYEQTQDVDLSIFSNFIPIGHDSGFNGGYDGNEYIIKNLNIHITDSRESAGLFADCSYAFLNNIRIINANVVNEGDYGIAGILAGYISDSTVFNCRVSGYVKSLMDGCGGIAQKISYSTVRCSAAIDVVVVGGTAGAFAGESSGSHFENSYATGIVSLPSVVNNANGLSGFVFKSWDGDFQNCYSVVKMNGSLIQGGTYAIKLVPFVHSDSYERNTVSACYFDCEYGVTDDEWIAGVEYYYSPNHYVRGTDGKVYVSIKSQYGNDGYYENNDPKPFFNAQPAIGSRWSEFWTVLDYEVTGASTTYELKSKGTYYYWDLDKIWEINDNVSYPTLRSFKKVLIVNRTQCNSFEWRRYA